MIKFFRYTLIVLFIGFFAAGTLLQTQTVRDTIKDYLARIIEEKTGYRVEIDDVQLFPSFQFNACGVTFYDQGKSLAKIKHLHLGIYPLPLWDRIVHLHTLRVEGVALFSQDNDSKDISLDVSLRDLPLALRVDYFTVEGFFLADADGIATTPVVKARGSLAIDPKERIINANVSLDIGEETYAAQLDYSEDNGVLHVDSGDALSVDAKFALSEKILTIPFFHLRWDIWTAEGRATLSTEGMIEGATLRFSSEDLSSRFPVGGSIYGSVNILGHWMSPNININVGSDRLAFQDVTVSDLRIRGVSYSSHHGLEGDVALSFLKDQAPYEFFGRFYHPEGEGSLPTRLTTKTTLSELTQLLGVATTDMVGDVDVLIDISRQEINGKAFLRNGKIESYALGSVISNIEAEIESNSRELVLKRLTAKDGANGTYSASGHLNWNFSEQLPYEFQLTINQAQMLHLDFASVSASGQLRLHGNLQKAELSGNMRTDSVNAQMPEQAPALSGGSVDITYINQNPNEPPPTPHKVKASEIPIKLDVTLEIPGNAKVSGKGLTSEWTGQLHATGLASSPEVHGELKIKEGKYKAKGRTLNLNHGSVTFAGDPEKKTTLHIIGQMEIDKYTIEVIVKGPINNPSISFRSNPPLSRKEILSWVLFNKDISDLSEFQGNKLQESIINLSSLPEGGPDLMTRIGDAFGIDRLDISGSPDAGQVSFELGKYVSESTYIFISRKPNKDGRTKRVGTGTLDPDAYDQTNRVGIETSISKHFKIQAEVDEDQSGQMNLIWKKDY